MARQSEEIDDNAGSGGGATTVMVGGMDDLIPGGKKEDANLDVVVEERKPPPGRRTAPDDDDDREEDARLAYDVSEDDEIEERGLSRRQRRNRQRKTVVAGRDQVIDALNAKVDALTNTINSMGQSQVGLTINNLDTQLGAAHQALNLADVEIKKAVGAGDLARYEELRGLREEAQTRYAQLYRTKQGIAQELQARGGQMTRPPQQYSNGGQTVHQSNLDQRTQDFTATFIDRFDFDPNGLDERTLIIKALDDSVAAEGYRSNTPLYWRTLEKKLAARDILPVDEDDDDEPRRPVRRVNGGGRPPTAGGSSNRRGTGAAFRLDPMARSYLEGEGLLHLEGLNDQQKAKRERLINNWREGQRKLARGEV